MDKDGCGHEAAHVVSDRDASRESMPLGKPVLVAVRRGSEVREATMFDVGASDRPCLTVNYGWMDPPLT